MPHMEGIFINGEKAKFHPEDILDTNASQYTEEIGESVSAYLGEHLTNPTNPPIDTSLSIAGAAADAKKTGDEISDLKNELYLYTGNKKIQFTDQYYIATNGDTTDFTPSYGKSYRYAVIECAEGDIFTINGQGAMTTSGAARLWAFATAGGSILSKAEAKATATNLVLVAPENAERLVINDTTHSNSYYGRVLIQKVDALSEEINAVDGKIGTLIDKPVDVTSDYTVLVNGKMSPRLNQTYVLDINTKLTHIEVPINLDKKFTVTIRQYAALSSDSYIAGVDSNEKIIYLNDPLQIESTRYVTYTIDVPDGVVKLYITSYSGSIEIAKIIPYVVQNQLSDLRNDVEKITINNTPRMKFAAHRGARLKAPEDSVPAFKIAGKNGFAYCWIAAVQTSADGTFYVMHDADVDRTTDGTGLLASMTDAQINALRIDYQPSGVEYQIYDFDNSELYVPTLEEVIQICLRYNMKMCFRMNSLPYYNIETADQERWTAFINLIKDYNLSDSIFSGGMRQLEILRNLTGDEWEVNNYIGSTTTAAEYVAAFAEYPSLAKNRSCIIDSSQVNEAAIKLLHRNDIKVYVYSNAPTDQDLENYAKWSVDILANPSAYEMPNTE